MKTHVQIDEKTNIPIGFMVTVLVALGMLWGYCEAHFAKASELAGMQVEIHQIYEKLIPEAQRTSK